MASSIRQKLIIISLLLYWPALFILTHIPIPQLVRKANVSDKSLHFIAYLILVFLLWFALNPDSKVNWRRAVTWWVLFVIAGYGGLDELLQTYVAGRSCDVRDFAANLVGTFTGLILFSFFPFWQVFLAVVGITIFTLTILTRANLNELLPITNAMFHLVAYGFFALVWIRYIKLFLSTKAPESKWLIRALALPMALLLAVKLVSFILGRKPAVQDVIISTVGIVAVVITVYLIALLRRIQDSKHKTQV